MPFFLKLEEEIVKATLIGKSVIIEMDANAKLGPNHIPEDPQNISPNGKLLEGIIQRQNLYVVNGSKKCKGNITRKRTTKNRVEESIIDIVLVSSDLIGHIESLEIDEDRRHVLTKIRKTKKGIIKKESDHNVLVTTFSDTFESSETKEKEEMYNLKNKECQKKFKMYTSYTHMLSSVLDSKEDINVLTDRLIRKIQGCIASTFKKVRITNNKKSKLERLYEKLSELKEGEREEAKTEVAKVVEEIAEQEQEKYKRIVAKLANTKHQDKLNLQSFWKLRKEICPKANNPPSVMLDRHGNILTSNKAIKERAVEAYTERLKGNKMKMHLKPKEDEINDLCEQRLKLTKLCKSSPWTMTDLEEAFKDLDRDKARDALGQANELFKEDTAGSDFKLAILKLMKMIKERLQYPK